MASRYTFAYNIAKGKENVRSFEVLTNYRKITTQVVLPYCEIKLCRDLCDAIIYSIFLDPYFTFLEQYTFPSLSTSHAFQYNLHE